MTLNIVERASSQAKSAAAGEADGGDMPIRALALDYARLVADEQGLIPVGGHRCTPEEFVASLLGDIRAAVSRIILEFGLDEAYDDPQEPEEILLRRQLRERLGCITG